MTVMLCSTSLYGAFLFTREKTVIHSDQVISSGVTNKADGHHVPLDGMP